jgi:aldose 1-epimerase
MRISKGISAPLTTLAAAVLLVGGCASKSPQKGPETVKQAPFGKTAAGEAVDLFTLTNAKGMEVKITNYGGIITSIKVPDSTGALADVALGFDTLDGYLKDHPYFGAIVGRYGNRIAKGKFKLNGVDYTLARNNGENSLHGGRKGFDKAVWTAAPRPGDEPALALNHLSKDGEEGYPGNLAVTVVYTLTQNNELKIDYTATSDKDTIANITNHTYFNLDGQGEGDILGHILTLKASRFTPVDAGLIPVGVLRPVDGTLFDFRQPTTIGERINKPDEQLQLGKGYDHNFVVDLNSSGLNMAARVKGPKSGRVLEVWTTEPGVQFYTGNFLDGTITGKGGKVYGHRSGFCLETQHFPDSPNQPAFPTTTIKAGETYRSTTLFSFLTTP